MITRGCNQRIPAILQGFLLLGTLPVTEILILPQQLKHHGSHLPSGRGILYID